MGSQPRAPLLPRILPQTRSHRLRRRQGAYSEWIVPQGTGRVRFDLTGGAGGATSSFTPAYLARRQTPTLSAAARALTPAAS